MAFLETASQRVIHQGEGPVKVVLEGAVASGDPIGISATPGWVLSADAAVEQPVLVAGEPGVAGDTITAYMMATLRVVTTLTNVATVGEKVSVGDTGLYMAATADYPDVGFVYAIDTTASLWADLLVFPVAAQLTVART